MIAVDPLPGWVTKLCKSGVAFLIAARTNLRFLGRTCTTGEFMAIYDDTAAARSGMKVLLPKNNADR